MTTEEMERLAASNSEMPDDLKSHEQLLFLTLRTLYQNFHAGGVDRDRAKREKSRIYVAYNSLKQDYDISEHHKAIRKRLSNHIGELYECGCPHCKKLLNIFVGIDREDIPQDYKEIYYQIKKLRDLVQERSERNAELATTIDKVRWAAEKNDIERVKEILKNV